MNKNGIVFLDAATLGQVKNLHLIKDLGKYTEFDVTQASERIERIKGNTIVITNKVIIDREVIDACPEIRLVCVAATGTNNIDLEYAAKKGIVVKNVAGYSTESVAQSTFSMLFHLLHQNSYYDKYVKEGEYVNSPIFTHHGREFYEIKAKKFGIIGLGTIGKRVAEIAKAFGADVSYYSTSGRNNDSRYSRRSLQELLSESDIISIHCPLNAETKNLIGSDELKLMQPHAILINMGRGGIVDEGALAEALNEDAIYAAALDVLTREPIDKKNPLLLCQKPHKLFITPHIAWASIESRELLVRKIADNITSFLNAE